MTGKDLRNATTTREAILDAVERVLLRDGFAGLGVNAVAREAGFSKVLIYRYFGSWEGLLGAFAESHRFWPDLEDLVNAQDGLENTRNVLIGLSRFLGANPKAREILTQELVDASALTEALARVREAEGRRLIEKGSEFAPADVDFPALVSIIAAGITYLHLRSRTAAEYNGIALREAEGWLRIEKTVERMLERMLAAPSPGPTGHARK